MSRKVNKKPGRPRSEEARLAILKAARELLEIRGLAGVTMEGIAERAGVGKPTVYRHWPNALAVSMAALMESRLANARSPGKQTGLQALETQLKSLAKLFATPLGRSITQLVASADEGTEIAKVFRNHFVLASREEGRGFLMDAIDAGDVRPDADVEVTLDLIYAPIFYRLMMGHQPLSARSMKKSFQQLLTGLLA